MISLILASALASSSPHPPAIVIGDDFFENANTFVKVCAAALEYDMDDPSLPRDQESAGVLCAGYLTGVAATLAQPEYYVVPSGRVCIHTSTPRVTMKRVSETYAQVPDAKSMSTIQLILLTYQRNDKCPDK